MPGGLQYFSVTHKISVWDGLALSKVIPGNLVSNEILILVGVEQFLKVLTPWITNSVEGGLSSHSQVVWDVISFKTSQKAPDYSRILSVCVSNA